MESYLIPVTYHYGEFSNATECDIPTDLIGACSFPLTNITLFKLYYFSTVLQF